MQQNQAQNEHIDSDILQCRADILQALRNLAAAENPAPDQTHPESKENTTAKPCQNMPPAENSQSIHSEELNPSVPEIAASDLPKKQIPCPVGTAVPKFSDLVRQIENHPDSDAQKSAELQKELAAQNMALQQAQALIEQLKTDIHRDNQITAQETLIKKQLKKTIHELTEEVRFLKAKKKTETNEQNRPPEPKPPVAIPAVEIFPDAADVSAKSQTQKEQATLIPRFNLAEQILAEHRKLISNRRKNPMEKEPVSTPPASAQISKTQPLPDIQPESAEIDTSIQEKIAPVTSSEAGSSEPAGQLQIRAEQLISEIVAGEIETLCRAQRLSTSTWPHHRD